MRKTTAVLCLAVALGAGAGAQGLPNPFDVGLGVRAMGFGGAYTALAQGPEALLYNPAGLGVTAGLRADSAYASPMGLYSVTWIAGAMPGLGAGIAFLSAGRITDPDDNPLAFSHIALVAGGALPADRLPYLGEFLPWPVILGFNLKYDRVQVASEVGGNVAVDLGALTTLGLSFGDLRLGLAILDLGAGIGLGERNEAWSTTVVLGAALEMPVGLILSTWRWTGWPWGWAGPSAGDWRSGAGLRLRAGW